MMKQSEWKKRMISMLLAMLMLVSSVFTTGFSVRAENVESDPGTEDEQETEDETEGDTKEDSKEDSEEDSKEDPEEGTEETPTAVEDLRLSKTYLNLETGECANLYVAIYPEDAVYEEIKWESDVPEIAQVAGDGTTAVVTADSEEEGSAVITVTVGEISASCEVVVTKKAAMLDGLKFTYTTSPDDVYELSDPDKIAKSYELVVPVTKSAVYIWPDLKDGLEDVSITASYTDYTGDPVEKAVSTTGSYTNLSFLLKSGSLTKTQITLTVTAGTQTEVYTIEVYRGTGMSEVTFQNEYGAVLEYTPAFAFDTNYYDLYVPSNTERLTINMIPAVESCTSFYVNGQEASQNDTLQSLDGVSKIVVGCTDGTETKPIEYIFRIKLLPVCEVNFAAAPEDMLISIYDAAGTRMIPEANGSYQLVVGENYSYIASKTGYVTRKGSFTAEENLTIEINLEKISVSGTNTSLYAEWGGVYKNEENQNILSASLPDSTRNAVIDWAGEFEALSGISLIDDMIYCYDKSNLMMIDRETGTIIRQTALAGKGQTENGNKPVYGDGKIFVSLTNGSIQAFDAFTLESLWLYQNTEGGLLTCGVKYDSGYLYAGLYDSSSASGALLCISAEDEDPSSLLEQKLYVWKQAVTGGYYKTCPYITNGNLYAVSYGGQLFCIDQVTGIVKQTVHLGTVGGTAAGVSYYDGRIYFSTVNGYVCSYQLTADGVDTGSCQSIQLGGFSESTPVIYRNRMYVGYSQASASSQPHGAAPYYMGVIAIDAETGAMSLAYQISIGGQLNDSVTLATGEKDGDVRVYFTENSGSYVKVLVIADGSGQTEASSENCSLKLAAASSEQAFGAVTAAEDGVLYVRNTSGTLYSVSRSDLLIQDVTVSDENAVIDGGSFRTLVEEHEIMVGSDVTSTVFSVSVSEGIDVTINGKEGSSCEIFLTDREADAEVVISNGLTEKTYHFHFYEVSHNTNLSALYISNGTNFSLSSVVCYYPAEELSEDRDTYTIRYLNRPSTIYLWVSPEEGDSNSIVVKQSGSSKKLTANIYEAGTFFYRGSLGTQDAVTYEITVTAPDGVTQKTYTVTIEKDTTVPVISNAEILKDTRTANSVEVSFTSSEAGTLYYLLYDKAQSTMPTTAMYGTTALVCETAVEAGENIITITDLPKENQYLYAVVKDSAGNYSVYTNPIQGEIGASPNIPMTGIELDTEELHLNYGESQTITAAVLPSGTSDEPAVTWLTSNQYAATVTYNGKTAVITAVGGGTAIITVKASVNGSVYTAQCKVTVPVTVTTVNLSSENVELYEGETLNLTASFLPSEVEVTPKIIWRNSNNTVAAMESDGQTAVIEALAPGTAVIEILVGTVSAKCTVTVKSHAVTGDVNQDGRVSVMDASVILAMIRGEAEPDLTLADLNGDGKISVQDASYVLAIIRGSNE